MGALEGPIMGISVGLAVVLFSFTVNGAQMVPDFVGYLVIVVSCGELLRRFRGDPTSAAWLTGAIGAAAVAALTSLGISPTEPTEPWTTVSGLAGLATLWCVALALDGHARAVEAAPYVTRAGTLQRALWMATALYVVTVILGVILQTPAVLVPGLLMLAAFVALVVLVWRMKDVPAVRPPPPVAPEPLPPAPA